MEVLLLSSFTTLLTLVRLLLSLIYSSWDSSAIYFVVHDQILLHVTHAWILLCCFSLFTQGMMGNYGPPFMQMQGPPDGMMGMGGTPPHSMGVPALPPQHYFTSGMAGYPGMPPPGKKHPHVCNFTSQPETNMICQEKFIIRSTVNLHLWLVW